MTSNSKRQVLIAEAKVLLGGVCVVQGCLEIENLEFDHIDRETKRFKISLAPVGEKTVHLFWEEVAKCQLLCKKHHREKTGQELKQVNHGTARLYKDGCRCDACVNREREYRRDHWKRKAFPDNCPINLHGTIQGYNKYKCRCKSCKLAKAETIKQQRKARLARALPHEHGQAFLYECGCRCEECRSAKNKSNLTSLQKSKYQGEIPS